MRDEHEQWQEEARQQIFDKNIIEKAIAANERKLNIEQSKYLGYEKDRVISSYNYQALRFKNTRAEIEQILNRTPKAKIILNAHNGELNFEYIKIATKYNHRYKIVADNQFQKDTGLVILKET